MPRRKPEPRPGQIGEYWPSKRPGYESDGESWHRTWYDAEARQTRRVSLGEADFGRACDALLDWFVKNKRPVKAAREDILIDEVLAWYWEEHAKHLASAASEKRFIDAWLRFWAGRSVSEITRLEQVAFRADLVKGRNIGVASIDRMLATGRAAILHAVNLERLESAPKIYMQQTKEQKRSAKPKGRPLKIAELVTLFDKVRSAHAFMYLMLAVGTLARPGAILQAGPAQYDPEYHLLALNPEGRAQNRKRRPLIPVAPTLRPWLEACTGRTFVQYRGGAIKSIRGIFQTFTEDLGAPVAPYSIRHTVARQARRQRVPGEELQLFLGHLPDDEVTAIYAPYEPDYLTGMVDAIEEVYAQVAKLTVHRSLMLEPRLVVGGAPQLVALPRAILGGIGDAKRAEVRRLILDRVPHAEIVRQTRVSSGTVSTIRKEVSSVTSLLRVTTTRRPKA